MNNHNLEGSTKVANLFHFKKERVAMQCICCGSQHVSTSPAVLMPFIAHRVFNWKPVEIDDSWGLKSIKNGFAYSICNSLFCNECGLLFLDIRFSDTEMSNLYQDYRGKSYTELRAFYEPGYENRNLYLESQTDYIAEVEAFISPFISNSISILDWGGDTGKNTPFKDKSHVFDVFDLSNKPMIDGAEAVSKEVAFSKTYDLVICSNVLEHVPYPAEILHDIKNTMSKTSILYLEVPFEDLMKNFPNDCLDKKRHWHEHINFYSKNSLVSLVNNCGFELIKMQELTITTPLNFENKAKASTLIQIVCMLKK